MSSRPRSSILNDWISRLTSYGIALSSRDAADRTTELEERLGELLIEPLAISVSSEESSRHSNPEFSDPESRDDTPAHVPLDGLAKYLTQGKTYSLGILSPDITQDSRLHKIVVQVAIRCAEKSSKKTLLIEIHDSNDATMPVNLGVRSAAIEHLAWCYCGVTNGPSSQECKTKQSKWLACLAELPRLKQEYQLVIAWIRCNDIEITQSLGKLFDGVVLLLDEKHELKQTARFVRGLQASGAKLLGFWSKESSIASKPLGYSGREILGRA